MLGILCLIFLSQVCGGSTLPTPEAPPSRQAHAIPWSQLGTRAAADYTGDGLSVTATTDGAWLRCVFQKLEAQATSQGLWLTSTLTNSANDRFRVVAASIGRASDLREVLECGSPLPLSISAHFQNRPYRSGAQSNALPLTGTIELADNLVRFIRPGLIEEYSVSIDGVRQDFIVPHPPLNPQPSALNQSPLRLELAATGAKVEPLGEGAQLVLAQSGRKIAYSRLRVTDATGRELPARMEVPRSSAFSLKPSAFFLAILVNDTDAVYPIRIDPTFSDANWISMGGIPGANGTVLAAAVDDSGNLYIGGSFTIAGVIFTTNIAKWNGSSWNPLGSGMNGYVDALLVSGNNLYAGGQFTTAGGSPANYIAKWNGTNWSSLGSGMARASGSVAVYALAISGSDLYVGGRFTTGGGSPATNIAKWDGNSWSPLASGLSGTVRALAVSGSNLYAGGQLSSGIVKWNGSSWRGLGSGISGGSGVYALAVSGNDVYAGGSFTMAGESTANHIAKWNGTNWSALGSGMVWGAPPIAVYALALSGSELYAAGNFISAGETNAQYIAKWNGSAWSALGSGMNGPVRALAVSGSELYAGGSFITWHESRASNIAKWNGTSWSSLGRGMGRGDGGAPTVQALAISGNDLYAGGNFNTGGETNAKYIAKWNGSIWTPLGSGINVAVYALAVSGSNLYAAGFLAGGGTVPANYIGKWNGSSWSAVGARPLSGVLALAESGSDLYTGGFFTGATNTGGPAITVNHIAKWNGSTWTALGSGMNSNVYALAVSGSDLYAGGRFTTAGGSPANYIAKWNGSTWTALGSGLDADVLALAVSGNNVYAAGAFTNAGGVAANRIAKWNGSTWMALGSGMDASVYALAAAGGDLYAAGYFTTAGGTPANYIAKWNGSSWSALGSGMNSSVFALAVSGSDLYAGGLFTTAGGKVSAYVARAYLERPYLSILRSEAGVTLSWPTFYETFVLQQNPDAANTNTWSTADYPLTTNGAIKSAIVPTTTPHQFFRLIGD